MVDENKKMVKEEIKPDVKKEEVKAEKPKKEEKPSIAKPVIKKKNKAIANGFSVRISLKASIAICKMISRKSPENAIEILEQVLLKKKAVPMRTREIGHRKGKGICEGRFPKRASEEIIKILKQLIANSNINEIENPIITIAKANKATRPYRSGGKKAKRTHIYLEAMDKTKLKLKKK